MNEQCGWDSGGCGEARPCATGCDNMMLGNGECDSACYTESCNWDLRDCECANVLDATSGFRTDGSQPGANYRIYQELCWLIRPKQRNVTSLTLSFARFDIENHFDQLRIYDGSFSRLDQLHGIVSGTELPATFASAVDARAAIAASACACASRASACACTLAAAAAASVAAALSLIHI